MVAKPKEVTMHNEIKSFFQRMKLNHGNAFMAQRVLECGSYDINGNPRGFFSPQEYVGIDWRKGPGVDEVSVVHDYKGRPDAYFDFVIATSLLEHDPHWHESVQRMCELLAYGGSILITCGGPGFHQHELETSPGYIEGMSVHSAGEYYGNLTAFEVLSALILQTRFRVITVEDDPTTKDIRIFAYSKMREEDGVPEGVDARTGAEKC